MCGGTPTPVPSVFCRSGLSPRVRGNLMPQFKERTRFGSIPACAGEPRIHGAPRRQNTVYPRVCGGTVRWSSVTLLVRGLSPRVRGNQVQPRPLPQMPGSIPACAGEPDHRTASPVVHQVYPRVCGGTAASGGASARWRGLSPRVRGNRGNAGDAGRRVGSIPACAGEPSASPAVVENAKVYPRVCGGTGGQEGLVKELPGLSPRVRGNPRAAPGSWSWMPVYPRVCGGTLLGMRPAGPVAGLSPRVRGNPRPELPARNCPRSIPACAGEPPPASICPPTARVYPRVCGGTVTPLRWPPLRCGLSPRVRGNRADSGNPLSILGSIPACAGEPALPTSTPG